MHRPNPVVNIAGTTILHQHEITFLTGANHCRAHAVAKMLAAAVISGDYPFAQSIQVAQLSKPDNSEDEDNTTRNSRVLWIDTVHSFYTACAIIDDLKQNFNVSDDNLRFMCLDDLGTFNERYECVLNAIIDAIYNYKPALVIIDDMDHLATECGHNLTENFYLMVREALDHTDIAMLCIGYNLVGKVKSTAGLIGKRLFGFCNNDFKVTNRGNTNLIQRVKGITCDDQYEFAFNINDKIFPQELIMAADDSTCNEQIIESAAVQNIFTAVISDNEKLSSEQLSERLSKHTDSLRKVKRHQRLIASAVISGIILRNDDGTYNLNTKSSNSNTDQSIDYFDYYINKSLITNTIPEIPRTPKPKPLTFIKNAPAPQHSRC